jgi:endonuclease YncB( thermonuclease family)
MQHMTLTPYMRIGPAAHALVIAALTITSLSSAQALDPLTGLARVIDGDTIAIGSQHIRLAGIDAPETDQVCLDSTVHRWTCGISARDQLSKHTKVCGQVLSLRHGIGVIATPIPLFWAAYLFQ